MTGATDMLILMGLVLAVGLALVLVALSGRLSVRVRRWVEGISYLAFLIVAAALFGSLAYLELQEGDWGPALLGMGFLVLVALMAFRAVGRKASPE